MAKKKGKQRVFVKTPSAAPPTAAAAPATVVTGSAIPASVPEQKSALRDQLRARFAYERATGVPQGEQKDYQNAVLALGADILRVGLLAALAAVQRLGDRGKRLLEDLAAAKIPGLEAKDGQEVVQKARGLDVDDYMIATRETLAVVAWLRRACQATFKDERG